MSVCVSVNPICATNKELNSTECVSSLSVYENHYLSASFDQPIKNRILCSKIDTPLKAVISKICLRTRNLDA